MPITLPRDAGFGTTFQSLKKLVVFKLRSQQIAVPGTEVDDLVIHEVKVDGIKANFR